MLVDAIDVETGDRTAHAARVSRLYYVARDLQLMHSRHVPLATAWMVVQFFAAVIQQSYGLGRAR